MTSAGPVRAISGVADSSEISRVERTRRSRGSTTAALHPSTIEVLAELGLADRFLALPHRPVPHGSDVPRCERSVTVRRTLTAVLGIRPEHVRFPAQPIP
jgi:hypothetical protein